MDYYLKRWQTTGYDLMGTVEQACDDQVEMTKQWLESLENGGDLDVDLDEFMEDTGER